MQQVSKCRSNICLTILGAVCFCLCSLRRIFPNKGRWHRAWIVTLELGLSVSANHEIDTSKISTQTALHVSLKLKSYWSSMISICISSGTSEGVTVEGLQKASTYFVKIKTISPPPSVFLEICRGPESNPSWAESGPRAVCLTSLM